MTDRFLVFDVLVLRGNLVVERRYSDRVRIAEDLLDYVVGDILQLKPIYKVSDMREIVDEFDSMKNDGLIFTRDEYDTGEMDWLWKRTDCVLKWKPVITVDLFVSSGGKLFWGDRGKLAEVQQLFGYEWPQAVSVDVVDSVHEFEINVEDKKIILIHQRHRGDVTHPNDLSTIKFNMESVIDNIDFITLQAVLGQITVGKRVKYQ